MSFLEELDQQLSRENGKLLPLQLSTDDIGGALLAILSRGLYTKPLDCIREYVQNAVDAQASGVTIKITGNSVTIFDEGTGMNLQDLLQARQFGLSLKSISDFVGFRGIGIYSGFDLVDGFVLLVQRRGLKSSCARV
ncbi:MAG: ATP-binding protein [Kouleothrix sp.]|nr:ATP-binding protein [Kouleothrix sp.]